MFAQESSSLIYVANDQRFFADNGLNVTIITYPSGLAADQGMLSGQVNIAFGSEFVIAENALANASVCTLGTVAKINWFYVVARTDAGINSISDLTGKRIGVATGTSGQYFLGTFLELNNINQSQVTLINVAQSQQPSALANGTVDAVITFQPYIGQIENLIGNETVMWPAQSNQLLYLDAICTSSWAAAHPDLVVRFLKSLVQAQNFVTNNQNQAMAIVENNLNESSSYLSSVWPDYQFTVTLDQSQILAMQNEAQWLINNNLTNATTTPNFLNYVYLDGLKSVNPGAENIIG
jgi:NitT/TauT family transport system substrate-binding protein